MVQWDWEASLSKGCLFFLEKMERKKVEKMDNQVRIALTGISPREEFFNEGETISQIASRLNRDIFPIGRVQQFYVNGQAVSDPARTLLRAGDTLSGAPKVDGGR